MKIHLSITFIDWENGKIIFSKVQDIELEHRTDPDLVIAWQSSLNEKQSEFMKNRLLVTKLHELLDELS